MIGHASQRPSPSASGPFGPFGAFGPFRPFRALDALRPLGPLHAGRSFGSLGALRSLRLLGTVDRVAPAIAALGPVPPGFGAVRLSTRIDVCAAECAKAPDEAGRLRAQRAGERVRLVEHEEVEPCPGEQLDVLLAGEKQL